MIVKMSNIRGNLYNRADVTREIAGSTASSLPFTENLLWKDVPSVDELGREVSSQSLQI